MKPLAALSAVIGVLGGCVADRGRRPPLDDIYGNAARSIGAERNPVIVIPGILGSNLRDSATGTIVWGAFVYGAADPDYPEGARLVALPMERGRPLSALRDGVEPDGVLETLEANVGLVRIAALEPYRGIIEALAAGRYVDRDIARAERRRAARGGPVDYAGLHFTCFQFDYDWRRDITEHAARLDALIRDAAELARRARGTEDPVKVDVVAHSMGGMVLRYYLMYGTAALPQDGSLPPVTWAGAERVEQAILVGTPSAGSVLSLKQLIEGTNYSPITPTYQPAVLGTMPAIYQLMPRERHARVVDAGSGRPIEGLFRAETWERRGWGLADPRQERYLSWLLPDVPDPAERRRIALDHMGKCLSRAEQLHRALDAPATMPAGLTLSLVLGDADPTPAVLAVGPGGRVSVRGFAAGDGTVTRASALMDEREGGDWRARLRSPIGWSHVQFIAADHLGLTEHPGFVDGLLFALLERPR